MHSPDDHRLPTLVFLLIITLIQTPTSFCQYDVCGQAYWCGNANLTYPFWGGVRPSYCGYPGFEVTCQGSVPRITVSTVEYRLLESPNTTANTIRVARDDLYTNYCPTDIQDTIMNFTIFSYSNIQNVTLFYDCSSVTPRPLNEFDCTVNGQNTANYFLITDGQGSNGINSSTCARIISVPIDQSAAQTLTNSGGLRAALAGGFTLRYEADNANCQKCSHSGGRCGYNSTDSRSFICYCRDHNHDVACDGTGNNQNPSGQSNWELSSKELFIGLCIGIPFVSLVGLIFYLSKRYSWWEAAIYWKSNDRNNRLVEDFMRNYGSIAPKPYSYSEIKKMTNSFADKLGHGGYGCVYRGKLSDGRLVAVKVLNKNKGNGEEFINEVATITRTSHVNIVTLVGFCYNRKKRVLIYEFMPNGSLDKFICNKGDLEWRLLYEIALGIARGLEYLNQGCNSRIIHFDIKPQNILLDADFCPKISDFGLAKLCKRKESVLSKLSARGTIGFIAPEVFCRYLGGVSHKSDVYSYGMMILEMVGLRRKLEIGSQQTSESGNYFPNWIYEHVELGKSLPLEGVKNEEEEETARKMILVGLWCIQTHPAHRPSISKVVEMLEGSLQSIQLPPRSLQDPPTAIISNQDSWTSSIS